jgi:hypothetical protein
MVSGTQFTIGIEIADPVALFDSEYIQDNVKMATKSMIITDNIWSPGDTEAAYLISKHQLLILASHHNEGPEQEKVAREPILRPIHCLLQRPQKPVLKKKWF